MEMRHSKNSDTLGLSGGRRPIFLKSRAKKGKDFYEVQKAGKDRI